MSRDLAEGLSRYFQSLLTNEGLAPGEMKWDEPTQTSDLIFTVENRSYLLITDADDANFVRMVFPNFYPLKDDEALAAALQAMSMVNGRCKGAKIHTNGANNNVIATMEFLISASNPSLDSALFVRYSRMLNTATDQFARIMHQLGHSGS